MKIVPALAIVTIIWILAHATAREFIITAIVLVVASAFYLLASAFRSTGAPDR
jgi:hypothetical protein